MFMYQMLYKYTLTKEIAAPLKLGAYDLRGQGIGNYALFGGGYGGANEYSAVVDVYTN